ncbi:phage tail tape measure protein [Flavonifractor plautii]|uniref:Phage tail tape measure protein n=1 Tax=Flavonifractor plautii TaxID=292800 RepID=A0A6I2R841_FLAPL|nr:phage tail tape measure protein [Flavonifractor plautii]MSB21170.1 phage tail tape measure protein [Flavonifractor plautii]MSB85289.1 phage tail tape measure protein [Flavonifractor plautii]
MAGRKEYELLFKLTAALGGNFNAAFSSALNTTRQMQNSLQKLNSITGKIDAYKKQEAALESNRQKLERLTAEHERLQREISETGEPTEELRAKMAQNERQIAATTSRIEQQEARLNELGGELSDAGVNTSRLTEENERLSKSYERVKKSQEELAKVNAALEQNNAAISKTKTQLAGTVGTLAALGTAIYAGPVRKAAEFEAQMSTVEAISGATADEMKRLSDEAKRMGATTKFTAVEAGKALEYMAMAGWKTDQMLGGLPGIMNLAAASGEDLGQVSDIVTDALTAFNMTADQSGRFADVLAQASSNANTNVSMMGATFQKVAPVAGALGYSVEDMSLGIGLMANASIKAEVAGTSLKTALANMAKPTKQMQAYMDKYGISLTNADGSMKTFREVIDNLRSSLGGLSESEQVAAATAIFGKESFAGMLAIVNASDADFKKLSDSVNNAAGAAERMAQIKLDNFEGKVTLLKSAFEGLQIALGDALLPTFTQGAEKAAELISKLTEFINANPELVRTIVKVTAGLLAFKAAALTAKLGFLELKGGVLTIQKVMALFKGKTALAGVEAVGFAEKVKGVAKSVTGYFGGIGSAAGGVGRAFGQMFSGTKIGGAFSKIGGAAGGVFSKLFSGMGGVATRAFTGVAGTITNILGKAGTAVAAGPLGKIGSVIGKGFGKIGTLIAPLQKLGGAILGPFSGILGKVLPVVGVISLIVAAVQILRDNLDKVREVVGRVFGDAGLVIFDKVVAAITNIGDTIRNVFTDGNLGGARQFLINLFGEEATGVIDGAITILQTVWNILSGFIEFVNTYVRPIVEQIFSFIVGTVLPQIAQAFAEWAPTIASILQGLAEVVSTIATAIMAVIQFLMPTIQSIIGVALETIKGVVSGALTAIKGIVDVFAGIFTGDWSRVWEGVKGIFSGVWNSLKSIASGVLNGIIGLINGVISGLNKLKIPDWVPGIGGKGINIPLIPTFAKGTKNTPDTFIAGEAGAELVTNARNRTVFNAAETGAIFRNLANTVNTIRAGVGVPALQLAYAGAEAPSVSAPSIASGARQASIVIHSAPVFHVGSEAQAEDIEELLRRHDEELLDEIEERKRQQEDDERRRNYD